MGGFGGVLKNMSIGIASAMGKSLIHSAGKETTGFGIDTPQDDFLEVHGGSGQGVGRLQERFHPLYQCDEPSLRWTATVILTRLRRK